VLEITAESFIVCSTHVDLLALGWQPRNINLFETEMGWDLAKVKVNVNGKAIALGHPMRWK